MSFHVLITHSTSNRLRVIKVGKLIGLIPWALYVYAATCEHNAHKLDQMSCHYLITHSFLLFKRASGDQNVGTHLALIFIMIIPGHRRGRQRRGPVHQAPPRPSPYTAVRFPRLRAGTRKPRPKRPIIIIIIVIVIINNLSCRQTRNT